MTRLLAIPIALLACVAMQPPATGADLHVDSDRQLEGAAAYALDVRWASASSIALTTMDDGVLEVDTRDLTRVRNLAYPHVDRERCFTCSMLGLSDRYLVTSFQIGGLMWRDRGTAKSTLLAFPAVVDIDVHDDKLLILGSEREGDVWAPDGALAWIASLSKNLDDRHSVLLTTKGANYIGVARCGFFTPGAVRFFPDGSFVIVPGVEPGVYLYGADNRLKYTWQTTDLGFFDRCDIPEQQRLLYMRDPEARAQWESRMRMVDDVLPLPQGPGLLVREVHSGVTGWRMIILRQNQPALSVALPFTAPTDVAHLRADLRGDQIAFIVRVSARWRHGKAPSPGRLVLAHWK